MAKKKLKFKDIIKAVGKQPFVTSAIGWAAFAYTWFVGKTGRFDVQGQKEFEELIAKHNGGIFVAWHGRALMLPYFWRNTRVMKALVSPHQDGRIIATLLRGYKILSIDGSSDRHALGAALEIVKELENGTVVSLISDGPRGPRMRLNKSVIYFAQKTGKPVMGFTYSSQGAKVAQKSWDAMLIPKLFKKGVVLGTKPLFVPKDASEEEMEVLRKKFEDELNAITFAADEQCGLEKILPGEEKKSKRF
ncbi:MAG: lysophospholipid acyltransferase family protein [Alphaproteobacteria bacterium]|nr:lysophospholipid acyltransferase family protein [Alphaproteobacteria bacterium]